MIEPSLRSYLKTKLKARWQVDWAIYLTKFGKVAPGNAILIRRSGSGNIDPDIPEDHARIEVFVRSVKVRDGELMALRITDILHRAHGIIGSDFIHMILLNAGAERIEDEATGAFFYYMTFFIRMRIPDLTLA
jgi:hypothetical protein